MNKNKPLPAYAARRRPYDYENMPIFREELGDVLRHIRKAKTITLQEAAEKSSISFGYLSEVERGTKEISSELLGIVCAALDVSLDRVLLKVVENIRVKQVSNK